MLTEKDREALDQIIWKAPSSLLPLQLQDTSLEGLDSAKDATYTGSALQGSPWTELTPPWPQPPLAPEVRPYGGQKACQLLTPHRRAQAGSAAV